MKREFLLKKYGMTFTSLAETISHIHEQMALQAKRAVNTSLTIRNWVIGFYIYEYEQNGSDRAQYGNMLLEKLALRLQQSGLTRMEERELRRYRQFYLTYPRIREALTPELSGVLPNGRQPATEIRDLMTPELPIIDGQTLITRLSFTHLVELLNIGDDLKRAFYEIECIRGNWSVRELKRQIDSLYYERSGLSKNKKKLARIVQKGVEKNAPELAIRDPYVFEFLGLKPEQVLPESDLENEFIIRLQEFLMELKTGFLEMIFFGDKNVC